MYGWGPQKLVNDLILCTFSVICWFLKIGESLTCQTLTITAIASKPRQIESWLSSLYIYIYISRRSSKNSIRSRDWNLGVEHFSFSFVAVLDGMAFLKAFLIAMLITGKHWISEVRFSVALRILLCNQQLCRRFYAFSFFSRRPYKWFFWNLSAVF